MKEFEYLIIPRHNFGSSSIQKVLFVKDIKSAKSDLDAQVRSGDYFSLLATKLDDLCNKLPKDNYQTANQIQDIISDLLYIQTRYKLVQE